MVPTPDPRLETAKAWLSQFPQVNAAALAPASSDASFRRYFRAPARLVPLGPMGKATMPASSSWMPPDKEPLATFLQTADLFEASGVHVPQRLAINLEQGFLLLSDLGQTPYLTALQSDDLANVWWGVPDHCLHALPRGLAGHGPLAGLESGEGPDSLGLPTTAPTSSWPRCNSLRTGTSADTWAAA